MIHLNLDSTPVAAGEFVALTPEASVVSLGEVKVGRRRFQGRRTSDAVTGRETVYLLDARGNAFILEGNGTAWSRNTGRPLTQNTAPAVFRFVDDRLVLA